MAGTWQPPGAGLERAGLLEIITCSATHAVLPLMLQQPEAIQAQIRVACAQHRACFGRSPAGFWLPECAYAPGLDSFLAQADLRWFVVDTHGLRQASPRPRYGVFAPVWTPAGVAAFGRDPASARQVWSREEGYPADPSYRDFYRDIGFDLDLDYLRPSLAASEVRSFTGLKYHRIGQRGRDQPLYDPAQARRAAQAHAHHFLQARLEQCQRLGRSCRSRPCWWRPTTRSCSATGGSRARSSWMPLSGRPRGVPGAGFDHTTDYLRQHAQHLVATRTPPLGGREGISRSG